ncbi:MAG: transcriptional regulator [Clostridiales bacterium GWF2_36_10]|nr:MAG: transcriptional regulator [Clostridiales bacterium GWF2_36_10]
MSKIRQDLSIGPNIQRLRKRSGLTQEQVIAKMQIMGCNTTRSIYSQIEIGAYNIRVSELVALHIIFNADYNEFFNDIYLQ